MNETIFNFLFSLSEAKLVAQIAVFLSDYFLYILIVFILGFIFYKQNRVFYYIAHTGIILATAWVGSKILKIIFKVPRPFVEKGFVPVVMETGYSFPSSHATVAFALASAVYFYNKKIGGYFYIFAILISLSRVVLGVHYPLDILSGAVLGILFGLIISRIFTKYF